MKRSWIGGGLLAVLLAAGLLVTFLMGKIHQPIVRDLNAAGNQALAGNWDRAAGLYHQAQAAWEVSHSLRACFADHSPMEEVDACFVIAEVYLETKEAAAFAAVCAETARKTEAMGDAHGLQWENLF